MQVEALGLGLHQPFGLTAAEVERRREAGQGNPPAPPTTRSYLEIVRENVFTFVNSVLFGLGIALVLVGRPLDALVSVGVVTLNTLDLSATAHTSRRVSDRLPYRPMVASR